MSLFEQTAVYLSMRKLLSMWFFSRVRERADVRVFYVRVDARYGVERETDRVRIQVRQSLCQFLCVIACSSVACLNVCNCFCLFHLTCLT